MSETTQEIREIKKQVTESSTKSHPTYLQTTARFFDEIEESISQYRQTIEDYQHEYVQSCRNNFELIVSAQKEFVEKSGTSFAIPKASEKIIKDTLESFRKAYSIQRQASFAMIKTATHNIKILNDNAESFAKLNHSIIQLCMPKKRLT